jgi:hypothetical protein
VTDGFRLRKWYFDVVSAEGHASIGYVAHVAWGPVSLHYASILDGARSSATLFGAVDPEVKDGRLTWACPALHAGAELVARAAPLPELRVLDVPGEGTIDWSCMLPSADVRFDVAGDATAGLGYGEVLTMTVAPWKLPWTELRWGRFVSESVHLVWIDTVASTWVFENGVRLEGARVSQAEIGAPAGARLRIEPGTVLREGRLGDTVLNLVPEASRIFPGRVLGLYECKWASLGHHLPSGERGWVIHEVVRWPS